MVQHDGVCARITMILNHIIRNTTPQNNLALAKNNARLWKQDEFESKMELRHKAIHNIYINAIRHDGKSIWIKQFP